jgi:hypothetical protein
MLDEVFDVLGLGKDRVRGEKTAGKLFPVDSAKYNEDVCHKKAEQKNAHIYVNGAAGLVAAEHPGQPLAP